jgi:uncharacterized protein
MQFEWDEEKDRANIAKHGLSFEDASKIFDGPIVSWPDDRRDYGELRTHTLGLFRRTLILAVIHTDRGNKIRIISARRADKDERKIYETSLYKTTHN